MSCVKVCRLQLMPDSCRAPHLALAGSVTCPLTAVVLAAERQHASGHHRQHRHHRSRHSSHDARHPGYSLDELADRVLQRLTTRLPGLQQLLQLPAHHSQAPAQAHAQRGPSQPHTAPAQQPRRTSHPHDPWAGAPGDPRAQAGPSGAQHAQAPQPALRPALK